MGYRMILKQYHGSVPVKTECWKLDGTATEQRWNAENAPCMLQCIQEQKDGEVQFVLRLVMQQQFEEPISLALEYVGENCSGKEYVFLPAAVYDGNRMSSIKIPYPPFHAGKTENGWEPVITDIPHLDADGGESRIQFCSGDMSTPAMGFYSWEKEEGFLMLTKHMVHERYTGFTVGQRSGQISFSVSCPAVREEKRYFFGELPDGTGFFPTCDFPSDDEGMILGAGEQIELKVCCYRIAARNLKDYFIRFHDLRENLETGSSYMGIPFSRAYTAIKEKYMRMNFREEGYFSVGTESEAPPACWQAGWVGGGINSYPFLIEDTETAHQQALRNLHFITENLQYENGWYVPMYAKGVKYGDG
ncbi:MAG: hypothetical protein HDR27_02045, partial [Lachnospiraceae bacterium]|nr:hypothetical protein [Lachnospiraceae bacterium]